MHIFSKFESTHMPFEKNGCPQAQAAAVATAPLSSATADCSEKKAENSLESESHE